MIDDERLVENLPVGLFQTTPDGTFLDVNETMATMLGAESKAEILERQPADFYVEETDREEFIERLEAEGRVDEREVQFETLDGGRIWVAITALQSDVDGKPTVEGIIQDITERKRIGAEVEVRERYLSELTESTDDVLWLFSADWKEILFVNSAFEDIWGQPLERVESDPTAFLEGVHPDDRDRVRAAMGELGEGEPRQLEYRVNAAEDYSRWVWVQAYPVRDETGSVVRIAGFARDITARKAQEQEMDATRKRLRTLLQAAPDAIVAADAETGVIAEVNEAAEALFGRSREEMIGIPVTSLHPDDEQGRYRELFGRHATGDQSSTISRFQDGSWVYARTADGERVPVEISARTVDLPEQTLIYGIFRDVAERKKTQDRFEALNGGAVDLAAASTMDAAFDITLETLEEGIGEDRLLSWRVAGTGARLEPGPVSSEMEAGQTMPTPVEPGSRLWECYESEEVVRLDECSPDLFGEAINAAIIAPVANYGLVAVGSEEPDAFDDTDVHLVTVLVQQLTAVLNRLDRERDLEATKRELERSNEELQQFAYVASHDLQEPLRMVSSYVELLDSEYGEEFDDEAREYMNFAVDGANRMREMINDLLQYSRVKTHANEPEPVDPDAIIDDVLQDLEISIDESDATITRAELPTVEADPSQLKQVFQNLLSNAIRYAGDEPPEIHVDAETLDESVRFSVRDEGTGISESQQDGIFEIFSRGQRDETGGTGIGLAICKRIVERHGGTIWVDSDGEQGTIFFFTLPLPITNE